jgi:Transposase DDE domain
VPFKHHLKGRRHIPQQRHQVTNWRDYDAALRNRGSLTVWFSEEALAGWRAQPRKTPGGQAHYSSLAIETALILRAVFKLALRQSEGLIGSIVLLLRHRRFIDDPLCWIGRFAEGNSYLRRRRRRSETMAGPVPHNSRTNQHFGPPNRFWAGFRTDPDIGKAKLSTESAFCQK